MIFDQTRRSIGTSDRVTGLTGSDAISNAVDYAKFRSRSHVAVIRVYAPEGSRTVGVWEAGIALGKMIVSLSP